MTTIVPTAVAACAARGEGGSPTGLSLIHVRTVKKRTQKKHTLKHGWILKASELIIVKAALIP